MAKLFIDDIEILVDCRVSVVQRYLASELLMQAQCADDLGNYAIAQQYAEAASAVADTIIVSDLTYDFDGISYKIEI